MALSEYTRLWQLAAKYSALGIEIAVAIAIGTTVGQWLDKRFATYPYLTLLGFVIGLGAAIQAVRRIILMYKR